MKIVIATNPFKDSLTSMQAARAIASGLKSALPRAQIHAVPIADGGDGTLACVAASVPCRRVRKKVPGPLGAPRMAEYLLIDNGGAAVVEMARASGLALLAPAERDTMNATALGTGLLIRDAVDRGCKRILIGIGGSATTEGGVGPAVAMGYVFRDARGRALTPVGGALERLHAIDASGADFGLKNKRFNTEDTEKQRSRSKTNHEPRTTNHEPRIADVEFTVACDVGNPLLGPQGAAALYGPQKGASPKQVARLEAGLKRLADTARRDLGRDFRDVPGAGAAGGMGFGLMTFLGARLVSGIEMMIRITNLEQLIEDADLLVTGEGRMDAQSAQGKAPFGLLRLAKKKKVPVIAFCGSVEDEKSLHRAGFTAVFPTVPGPMTLEDAMANAEELLCRAATRAARVLAIK